MNGSMGWKYIIAIFASVISSVCLAKYKKTNLYNNVYVTFPDDPCEDAKIEMPDFNVGTRKISEVKCLEYVWRVRYEQGKDVRSTQCEKDVTDRTRVWGGSNVSYGEYPHMAFQKKNSYKSFKVHQISRSDSEQNQKQVLRLSLPNYTPASQTKDYLPYLICPEKQDLMTEFVPQYLRYNHITHEEGAIGWRSKTDSPKWQFKCGSTLISNKFVLTAAHCSRLPLRHTPDISDPNPHIIRFGVANIDDNEFNVNGVPIDVKIKQFIRHSSYKSPKKYNDIALIELASVVEFKSNLHPACLWPYSDISHLGTEGILSGWGYTEAGKQATELQAAVVDFIETPKCNKILERFHNRNWAGFQESQLCAGKLVGGIDTCQGDSGGPLQTPISLRRSSPFIRWKLHLIIGVTSFGFGCARANTPSIYTRVASFVPWIESIVWPSNTTVQNRMLST